MSPRGPRIIYPPSPTRGGLRSYGNRKAPLGPALSLTKEGFGGENTKSPKAPT